MVRDKPVDENARAPCGGGARLSLAMRRWVKGAARAKCLLLAATLVFLLFADVLLRRGSLSPLDYDPLLTAGEPPPPPVSLLPERAGRRIDDGWGDMGAALYQMQPAQKFLAYALRSGESSFWDPYSATGMIGPETLADVKFSAVNFVSALLGARSSHFSFILLALYIGGLYALLRLLSIYLRVSMLAALAACAAFMLNGFALMNLNTQIGQPYFLAPMVLLSLLALTRRITMWRVVLSILAHVVLFSVTFFSNYGAGHDHHPRYCSSTCLHSAAFQPKPDPAFPVSGSNSHWSYPRSGISLPADI